MYYVYLLTSKPYGTLYIGWTTDLARRVWEHKNKVVPGFTTKYGVDRLVWFESHDDREAALRREKQIEGWKRDWKINLIESQNRIGPTSMTACLVRNNVGRMVFKR
jgi:putative endonuclease